MPALAGIQDIRLTGFWIALMLHFLSCLRRNDADYLLKLLDC